MAPDLNELPENARVVLMCGVSGSGKTVLSRRIEQMGFVRLSADELIWERYGDTFPDMPADERRAIFGRTATEIENMIDRALTRGERVVVDSTLCRRAKRDAIRQVCRRHDVTPLFLHLDPDADTLRHRLGMRTGSGPNDQIVPECDLESFIRNFEHPGPDETDCITLK